MDLSTPQRFNKRHREKNSPDDVSKNAKIRSSPGGSGSESEEEGNDDIFNNEEMENPNDGENGENNAVRFQLPAKRR